MLNKVIWMDSEKAIVFSMKLAGIERSQINKRILNHHTQNKKDMHTDSNAEHFYHDLATSLKEADQILIMGPGLSKKRFKNYLESHPANGIAKKIIALENSNHPSDNQILAASRKFFKTFDLYHNPI
ncbi:MAG: hypothetical protein WA160_14905 [Pseudobdellovibrio sp.]